MVPLQAKKNAMKLCLTTNSELYLKLMLQFFPNFWSALALETLNKHEK